MKPSPAELRAAVDRSIPDTIAPDVRASCSSGSTPGCTRARRAIVSPGPATASGRRCTGRGSRRDSRRDGRAAPPRARHPEHRQPDDGHGGRAASIRAAGRREATAGDGRALPAASRGGPGRDGLPRGVRSPAPSWVACRSCRSAQRALPAARAGQALHALPGVDRVAVGLARGRRDRFLDAWWMGTRKHPKEPRSPFSDPCKHRSGDGFRMPLRARPAIVDGGPERKGSCPRLSRPERYWPIVVHTLSTPASRSCRAPLASPPALRRPARSRWPPAASGRDREPTRRVAARSSASSATPDAAGEVEAHAQHQCLALPARPPARPRS